MVRKLNPCVAVGTCSVRIRDSLSNGRIKEVIKFKAINFKSVLNQSMSSIYTEIEVYHVQMWLMFVSSWLGAYSLINSEVKA